MLWPMPRPVIVVLGWLAATAAAIAVAYAGVSAVAGRVVDPLPATLGFQSADGTPSDGLTPNASETGVAPASVPSGTPDATSPSPSGTAGSSPPSTAPTQAPAQLAAAEVRSYPLVGGNVTLRYEPGRVTVVSADAAQGFIQEIDGNGTAQVTVEFESDGHRSRLRGEWRDGGPRDRVEEDDRSSGGGDDDDDDDGDDGADDDADEDADDD